ncbi:MOSC domain-containing protein [Alicyclobacillus sp. ALC3]|uniref:MOSC domain-containing protein n=1 Tax=Alicyclobacillus sp. ALC3 TaxID=2796143 RepID=UPI0023797D45|nr:MOSC domain-containing protein [Alicyclobacillus sp. ALC3]WDL99602.1 MOSC domain-containing protein [Alicyclobacillus sp. ALC3]
MAQSHSCTVEAVLIANQAESFITSRLPQIDVTYGGIAGDRHFGLTKRAGVRESMYPRGMEIFNRRQITVVSMEECAAVAEALGVPEIRPEWLGANVVVRGFPDLTRLSNGSRILFPSGAGLLCEGENQPCRYPGDVIQSHYPDVAKLSARFVQHAQRRRGIICIVERPGAIAAGEEATVTVYED